MKDNHWEALQRAVDTRDLTMIHNVLEDAAAERSLEEEAEKERELADRSIRKFRVRCVKDAYTYYYGEVEAKSPAEALRLLRDSNGDGYIDWSQDPEINDDFDDHEFEVDVCENGAAWEDYVGLDDVMTRGLE